MSREGTSKLGVEFAGIVDSLKGHAIFTLLPDGRVADWNPAAERLTGYPEAQIVGEPFARFFTLEDRRSGVPERLLAAAERLGVVETEGWRVRRDGARYWAEGSLQAIRAGERLLGFAKVIRDSTEQRTAQAALRESEHRFRLLVDGVIDHAIFMLDPNGLITQWNSGAERIMGYGAREVMGRHYSLFFTADQRQAGVPAEALEGAKAHGSVESEGWRVRKSGARFWGMAAVHALHDDDGRHIGFAKIVRDISQRKAAEEALAHSERQFRLLVQSVTDSALVMLDLSGVVVNWNAGAERILGYAAEEILGHHLSRFHTETERAAGAPLTALKEAQAAGRHEAEGWRLRRDGARFWAAVVIEPARDEFGRELGFAMVVRDITERRFAQQELDRARDRMAQARKLEALGQLTGGVAHDFNNLLMIVSGALEALRPRASDERGRRAVEAMEAALRQGEGLTRHLLGFAGRRRGRPVTAPAGDRLLALQDLAGSSLPRSITLCIDAPPDLWAVCADQGEFELALLNLALNARDAMPAGGRLSLSARNVIASGVLHPGAPEAEFVAVEVRDEGQGMAPDILERVFEPFFTTKAAGKGTGLGLAQVHGFVQSAGGAVRVESRLGEGACFTLYLPRAPDEEVGEPCDLPADAGQEDPAHALVLIVEDNPEVAEVAAAFIEQLGHSARLASNAAEALGALQDARAPDVVFSDIVMAGAMDGLGLARLLRERHPDLPVVLATGYGASEAAEEFEVIDKPYKLEDLDRFIRRALADRAVADEANLVRLDDARAARAARAAP